MPGYDFTTPGKGIEFRLAERPVFTWPLGQVKENKSWAGGISLINMIVSRGLKTLYFRYPELSEEIF
jgi:hypothetical protein